MPKGQVHKIVYKSNELIEGQYNLSAAAQKVAASLISNVNPKGDSLPVWECTISEYAELIGISRDYAYESIDAITTELMKVIILLRKPGSKSFVKLNLFRRCSYDESTGLVNIMFEEMLDVHLRDFAGNFTKYQLKHIKSLKSRYAIRLYEILRKAHPIKTTRAKTFCELEIKELRMMLGAGSKSYGKWREFHRRVLDVAVSEINEKTDIVCSFSGVRKGKRFNAVKFEVAHGRQHTLKKPKPKSIPEPEPEPAPEPEQIIIPGSFSAEEEAQVHRIKYLLPDMPLEVILEDIEDMGWRVYAEATKDFRLMTPEQVAKVRNPIKYFRGMIKNHRNAQLEYEKTVELDRQRTTEEKLWDTSWSELAEFLHEPEEVKRETRVQDPNDPCKPHYK